MLFFTTSCVTVSNQSDDYLLSRDCNRRVEIRVKEGNNIIYKDIYQYLIYVEQGGVSDFKRAGILRNKDYHWHHNIQFFWQKFLE